MIKCKPLLCLALFGAMIGHTPADAEALEAVQSEAAAPAALENLRWKALGSLIAVRQQYPKMFARAYASYPALPAGSLEAIAYAQTGWRQVEPAREDPGHAHLPPAYGLMGLYQGGGFDDQVAAGARLIGLSKAQVERDPQANILAAAALLDQALQETVRLRVKAGNGADAALAEALQRYAGFGQGDSNIESYARESFAYSVLTSMDRGIQADGVTVPRREIDISKAFAPERLRLLQAPVLTMNHALDSIVMGEATAAGALAGEKVGATPVATKASVDFGEAIWNPASTSNYSTAGNSASAVILHTMEGSYAGAISWFKNPSAQVSAHYCLRKSDGQITQMVREHHQAWHAAYHNSYTIGLEHDGYASDPANWSAAMVNASARLVRSICTRRGVNCASAWRGPGYNYWHVVPDSVRIKGHGMLTNNQNRYDPGQYFPWASYYSLLNNGAPPPAPVDARYWVDTFANAPGYGSPTSTAQTGTLYQGTSYVYCKTWGREVRNGSAFNHWWLKTDLDVGPGNQWVSGYYLSRWGNDEARDNDGYDLPRCEVLPYGKIGEKWSAMGGVRSVLGTPKLAEMAANLGGRFQEFVGGIILWHPRTGAYAVRGAILQQFWASGNETRWQFPTMDELNAARSPLTNQQGRYQYFEKGLFLWTPATGAHAVYGAILTHFENTGRETRWGFPKGEEEAWNGNGRRQVFEKGTFYWTAQQGVWTQ
ncbi:MAG: N-acetylmuramoyl-L-alanine amidase [Xanthomonadales bacterium]|nr:hypothetical protein [Xanthomonadales bacterium]MCC6593123.1 N-acetylmuramoyl-L-alanine amidase [Xanthomonadales bacterium]